MFKSKLYSLLLLLVVIFIFSCGRNDGEMPDVSNSAGMSNYIAAHTDGVVSIHAPIEIILTMPLDSVKMDKVNNDLIKFEPKVKGEFYLESARTLKFKPSEPLKEGTGYKATFYLDDLLSVPDSVRKFEFAFMTKRQDFDLFAGELEYEEIDNAVKPIVKGFIETYDLGDLEEIKKMLSATQDGKSLSVDWTTESEQKFSYIVRNVNRGKNNSKVIIRAKGSILDLDKELKEEIDIPAMGTFKVVSADVFNEETQKVVITFSDPLNKKQNINGLVKLGNRQKFTHSITTNQIILYPNSNLVGSHKVVVYKGIQNAYFDKLPKEVTLDLMFQDMNPSVTAIGEGVIIPSSDEVVFPFEAVNLSKIDVRVIQIYENNLLQFLQSNELSGNSDLKRVGRPVAEKTIDLKTLGGNSDINLKKVNRFGLNLKDLIKKEEGALYQVQIGFRPGYSLYECEEQDSLSLAHKDQPILEQENWDYYETQENSYWDYYDDYYWEWDYDYEDREDPCKRIYFTKERILKRNVLASNIGVIAKKGNDNKWRIIVTDLISADPIQNAQVEIYNLQQQLITTANTNGKGIAELKTKGEAFAAIVKHNTQRSYVKLGDGNSLSISSFPVSGTSVKEGLKGLIYGERGVWRPGDTLFLSFILEDENRIIPQGHPISMSLYTPQGKLYKKSIQQRQDSDITTFKMLTDDEVPTGNWRAEVSVGPNGFMKTIPIEAIKPNRLKINLEFDEDEIDATNRGISGDLNVKWLHGATAGGLDVEIDALVKSVNTTFDGFSEYEFDDKIRSISNEKINIFDSSVNSNGDAEIDWEWDEDLAPPGKVNVYFSTTAYEPGGDFSKNQQRLDLHPYNSYIGIKTPKGGKKRGMLLTDTLQTLDIVNVDKNGKLIKSNDNVSVTFYKVEWRYWWDNKASTVSNFNNSSYTKLLDEKEVKLSGGKGKYKFQVEYPDWGRYLMRVCDDESGHCSSKIFYMDWPNWAGKQRKNQPGGPAYLDISLDKDKAKVGEDIEITIPTGKTGKAFVSIETGTGILDAFWVQPTGDETSFTYRIREEMAPTIYVHATVVQPYKHTENDLPIRLYGVAHLAVENPQTILKPTIQMPEVLKPASQVNFSISEENDAAMWYTIAVVDEGLLDLTNYKTPDPHKHFYAKEAIGVKTWDIYDYVLGAYGGKLDKLLSIGGDEFNRKQPDDKAKRFKPVVKFLGPFYKKKGQGKVEHSFRLPEYVGAVRTMIIAAEDGAYGNAEKSSLVKNPIMILPTFPRVIGLNEQVKLPVNVFSLEEKSKSVNLSVKANDFFKLDQKSTSLSFSKAGDKMAYFQLSTGLAEGVGTIEINAKAGKDVANDKIEVQVRNPNPFMDKVTNKMLSKGATTQIDFDLIGTLGTNTAYLEVSKFPALDLRKRVNYLTKYPHGCLEQTTSGALPLLFLDNLIDRDLEEKKVHEAKIKSAIARVNNFQHTNGRFSTWPGRSYYNDWANIYVGQFLTEAKGKGYSIPANMLNKWSAYHIQQARNWRKNNKYRRSTSVQAYRLFALAIAGEKEIAAMNRLKGESDLGITAQWRLAAAYHIIGQTEVAATMIANLTTNVDNYREYGYTFGSDVRDMAFILEAMIWMDKKEQGWELVQKIAKRLSNGRWMSTQEVAWAVMSISKYAGDDYKSENIQISYTDINGKSKELGSNKPILSLKVPLKESQSGQYVKVNNKGASDLFARLINTGKPLSGKETAASSKIQMNTRYTDLKGNAINQSKIKQGETFIAEVTIVHTGEDEKVENLALSQIFPSGWEILNERMDAVAANDASASMADDKDIRDDRVINYFDLNRKGKRIFKVKLNAAYLGKFYLPAHNCEAMYDNSVSANTKGMWIEVVE